MSFLSVSHLCAAYGASPIVQDVSFSLNEGELLGVLGANGSGKTTLLKSICGILPHRGSCVLRGATLESLSARQIARLCSYIPQRSGISIDISALDVVLMGFNPHLKLLEHPTQAMKSAAQDALDRVGLSHRAQDNYLTLSEGQKQLCILARTLVSDASLLILDEPESALDFRFRNQMLHTLRAWLTQPGRAGIVALHDPTLALNCCDRLLLLSDCGKTLGTLHPRTDAPAQMAEMLSAIYGPVSLHACRNARGKTQLLMISESEEP